MGIYQGKEQEEEDKSASPLFADQFEQQRDLHFLFLVIAPLTAELDVGVGWSRHMIMLFWVSYMPLFYILVFVLVQCN